MIAAFHAALPVAFALKTACNPVPSLVNLGVCFLGNFIVHPLPVQLRQAAGTRVL